MKVLIKVLCGAYFLLSLGCGKDECKERIKEDCNVTYDLNPVCGCNEKTYGNPSIAACSGIEEFTLGACP